MNHLKKLLAMSLILTICFWLPISAMGEKLDQITKAQIITNISLNKIHDGNHYFVKNQVDIDGIAGLVTYFMFRTPNTKTRIHAKAAVFAEGEFIVEIYEGGTLSADGTPITGINNDRDSSNNSELTAFSGPTVTDDGLLIWGDRIGSGKSATVSPGFSYEIVAKTNEIYLFKLTKIPAGTLWIASDFWWHESIDEE